MNKADVIDLIERVLYAYSPTCRDDSLRIATSIVENSWVRMEHEHNERELEAI